MSSGPGYVKYPAHLVDTEPVADRIEVFHHGRKIAETLRALRLTETGYDPVIYIPKDDLIGVELVESETRTSSPFKGEASYYSVADDRDIAWSYERPYDEVAELEGMIAFNGEKVEIYRS